MLNILSAHSHIDPSQTLHQKTEPCQPYRLFAVRPHPNHSDALLLGWSHYGTGHRPERINSSSTCPVLQKNVISSDITRFNAVPMLSSAPQSISAVYRASNRLRSNRECVDHAFTICIGVCPALLMALISALA